MPHNLTRIWNASISGDLLQRLFKRHIFNTNSTLLLLTLTSQPFTILFTPSPALGTFSALTLFDFSLIPLTFPAHTLCYICKRVLFCFFEFKISSRSYWAFINSVIGWGLISLYQSSHKHLWKSNLPRYLRRIFPFLPFSDFTLTFFSCLPFYR